MPAKTYSIHFADFVSQKERGGIVALLDRHDVNYAISPLTQISSSVFPMPGVDWIRVVDEYGTFAHSVMDKLPEWCRVTSP